MVRGSAKEGSVEAAAVSLEQLDAFVAAARHDPDLKAVLEQPLELAAFLALARGAGYALEEADVIAAQARAEQTLSDHELQRRAGEEARRLRHFVYG
jgi:predicted ribosomally synthesized peptide with nif11-like leader